MNTADQQRYAESTRKVEDVTTKYRLPGIAENILRNLHRVTERPQHGVNFRGTVIVCGAGPSLTHSLPYLAAAAGRVPIIAVNTAAPALGKAGVPIDVLVSIECLDLSKHIRAAGKVGTIVLDLMANPAQWEAAKESGARIAWILEAATHTAALAYGLGIEPHQSGGFGGSAAMELARIGGASEIILCGFDLGYPTGKAYADGSGWGGLEMKREGDRLIFTGREDRDVTHTSGGVPALPRSRPYFDVPAWGGEGTIPAVIELVYQRDWIAAWHRSVLRASGVRMVNSSIGGANVPGVDDLAPSLTIPRASGQCWHAGQPATREALDRVRQVLREEAMAAKVIAEHFTKPTPWPRQEAKAAPIQMCMALAAYEWMSLRDAAEAGTLSVSEAIAGQYRALEAAADRLEALCS